MLTSQRVNLAPGGQPTRGHNEGSLIHRRREKRWYAAVTMPDGSRRERSTPKWDNTKDGAKAVLRDLLDERDAQIEPPARKLTLEGYLRSWLAEMDASPRVAPSTVKSYRIIVDSHILPELGTDLRGRPVLLAALGPAQIQRWLDAADAHPRTVQHWHACLRRALNVAVRRSKIVRNPALAVELPEIPEREVTTYTAAQLRTLLDGTEKDWYGPLWALLAGTGLRISEALGLAWDDVDLEAGTIAVHMQLARRGGQWARIPRLKAGRTLERVALPAFTTAALDRHKRRMAEARKPDWTYHGLVFVTPNGTPPYAWHVTEALYEAEERLKLPKLSPHGFRHSSITLMADAGVAEDVRMRRVGHSTRAMARHYTHEAETADAAAAAALDVAVGGAQ